MGMKWRKRHIVTVLERETLRPEDLIREENISERIPLV